MKFTFSKRALAVALVLGSATLATAAGPHTRIQSHVTHVIEVHAKTAEERTAIANLGFSIDELRSDKVYIFGRGSDVTKLRQAGFRATAHTARPEWFQIERNLEALADRYTSLTEVETQLQELATQYPNLVELRSLGRSVENRTVRMVRISGKSPAQAQSQRLPAAFFMGCHHAREHLSVEVPLRFAKYLVENYGKDPNITRLVDTREIFIAPVVNPDGHAYDYTNGTRGRMWRKNRRRNNDNSYGVDLNRNYGFQWGTGGSSSSPSSDVYMGPTPFSEPETQNLRDFITSQPRITTLLSFHTFSELILYPWGHSYSKIGDKLGNKEDLPVFEKMARDMAVWNKYKPMQSSGLYIASGDTTDWAYGERGIFAFTFELSPASMWDGGFYPNPSRIEPTFQANINPMLYLLEYSDNPRRVLRERLPAFLNRTPARNGIPTASFHDIQI